MKERPILFNGEMVRALLDGRKTQTRRVIKPQPLGYTGRKFIVPDDSHKAWHDSDDFLGFCPYGQPGGRLWVRESTEEDCIGSASISRYCADGAPVLYSGCDDPEFNGSWALWDYPRLKRPSIHMPRWASRILLEVTAVGVERLQDISEEDALAEGIDVIGGAASTCPYRNYRIGKPGEMSLHCSSPMRSYMTLWESINGPGSWAANPWVCVVEFHRVGQQGRERVA